jgi:hypothetical protein
MWQGRIDGFPCDMRREEVMDKTKRNAILLIGLAWPAVGLGFMALHFNWLPSGLSLLAETLGLFLAGMLSGVIFLTVRRIFEDSAGSILVNVGYILFAPIAIMTALIAPGMGEEYGSPLSFVLVSPLMIVMYSSAAMAAGMGLTVCLGIVTKILSERFESSPEHAAETVHINS